MANRKCRCCYLCRESGTIGDKVRRNMLYRGAVCRYRMRICVFCARAKTGTKAEIVAHSMEMRFAEVMRGAAR